MRLTLRRFPLRLGLLSLALGLVACSGQDFEGTSARRTNPPPAASQPASTPPESMAEGNPSSPGVEISNDSADAAAIPEGSADSKPDPAIKTCLDAWKDHPFPPADLAKIEVATVQQSNKNNRISYRDATPTAAPRLVVLRVESKNINSGLIELLNPNGWYCVTMLSKNTNQFSIDLDCNARLVTLDRDQHVAHDFTVQKTGC